VNEQPPPLAQLRPDLPAPITSYVMRALEKDQAKRHPSLKDAERVFRSLVPDEAMATTELVRISLPQMLRAAAKSLTPRPQLRAVQPVETIDTTPTEKTPVAPRTVNRWRWAAVIAATAAAISAAIFAIGR